MELIHECFLELVEFYLVDEGGDIPMVAISFNTGDNGCDQQHILLRLRLSCDATHYKIVQLIVFCNYGFRGQS